LASGHQADEATSFAILNVAIEGDVTLFESANVYPALAGAELAGESERTLGRRLATRGVRDRVTVVTKVFGRVGLSLNDAGLGRKHIIKACEESLRRLPTGSP
jgi:NDP-hexose 2,3-enoyl reductase